MKVGDRINTVYGAGTIVDFEVVPGLDFSRPGVKLDENPFTFSPAYMFPKAIKPFKTKKQQSGGRV